MGYRSEVAIKIQYEDMASRNKILGRLTEQEQKHIRENMTIEEDRPVIWFYASHVKWYTKVAMQGIFEGFPEYNAIERLLSESEIANTADEDRVRSAGMFLRIGEEYEDIESHYWMAFTKEKKGVLDWDFADPYEWGGISRNVHFDENGD